MDTGGPSQKEDRERQAAAAIARRKVLAAYENQGASRLKDTPKSQTIDSESWKKYHTAWQDYYQKYYSEYYAKAARTYIEQERLKAARDNTDGLAKPANSSAQHSSEITEDDSLREHIRKKATDSAKKSRRHRRLIPIFAGLTVVLAILFLQYNRLIFAPIMAYISPGNVPPSEIEAIDPTINREISSDPKLIIPKLNIDVPIHFDVAIKDVMSAMNNGVAHYRIAGASAYPGEIGNFVITGHSAGDIYSSNPYKFIFSGLERLEAGDLIYVNYNSVRYTYSVTGQKVIDPSDVAALVYTTDKPILTLVTCYPVGTSRSRLLLAAEQISPTYGTEQKPAPDEPAIDDSNIEALPSTEPSFFEGIWNWLTGN